MIRLGIIGMSVGNAHPYSWSSIINGSFDPAEIARVGYPAVAAYLTANADTLGIDGTQVTHVWCQEESVARSIARSAAIPHVVNRMEDMIGHVDAVILARDDPGQHMQMASPFLAADVPLFIDKPLSVTMEELHWFSQQEAAGKFLMSCSSMRYAAECRTAKTFLPALGELQLVTAVGKKDWTTYGIHMVEGLSGMLEDPLPKRVQYVGAPDRDIVLVDFAAGFTASFHLFKHISPTFQFTFYGKEGWHQVEIQNSYIMFKETILTFVKSLRAKRALLSFTKTYRVIEIVSKALESKALNGNPVVIHP
ncbi:Gfo/Idh/MocA family oxidoreductase [Olivibacter sp. SDN3]|uniref:Gfo/Idh/MocA family oxidoreductase n=1 Tax=Olivibacter sp. SDN3 TaxID=2764720 RepID=UPI0016515B8B|nr:Gfo/Idh/MocA family oxidoreductase [Olivibacter sp. SDN3]QNL51560.1 Gfo/Idh/MocA family oxidoreductase [Olivibacter sp. SDN3]